MRRGRRSGLKSAGRRIGAGILPVILAVAGYGAAVSAEPTPARIADTHKNPHDIATLATHIEDMEAKIDVVESDMKALEKIGRDFGINYRFRHVTLDYKQPDKLRLETKSQVFGSALLIQNGSTRYVSVPKLRQRSTENLENAPSRRQSLLEFSGLLSRDTLQFMQGRFVQEETLDGSPAEVYDLTYQGHNAGSHYRVWIDPKTHITRKRAWYGSDGNLRAVFRYEEPREVAPGVWMPTHVEVKNADGVTAAATTYSNIKINQGLDDSLFAIAP